MNIGVSFHQANSPPKSKKKQHSIPKGQGCSSRRACQFRCVWLQSLKQLGLQMINGNERKEVGCARMRACVCVCSQTHKQHIFTNSIFLPHGWKILGTTIRMLPNDDFDFY